MFALITTVIAFILFYIYDYNSVKWRHFIINKFFGLGSFLLLFSLLFMVFSQIKEAEIHLFGIISVLFFLILLVHTLFFAIPFKDTYIKDEQNRLAYTHGVYALCRHPGVIWLLGLTVSLYYLIPTNQSLLYIGVINILNYVYIVLQDVWTFPNTFTNYTAYKMETPFLIPNIKSIKMCFLTIHHTPGGLYESEK